MLPLPDLSRQCDLRAGGRKRLAHRKDSHALPVRKRLAAKLPWMISGTKKTAGFPAGSLDPFC